MRAPFALPVLCLVATLAACGHDDTITRRSLCPAIAVPQYAGELTRFQPPERRDSAAIALTAAVTGVRQQCTEGDPQIATHVSFQVIAQRRDRTAAETISLPVFISVVRGGDIVVSKQIEEVPLRFAAGQAQATGVGAADTRIAHAAAALPQNINKIVTRERKPGEQDAALDPLAEPKVRDAVHMASFEVLVGFALAPDELAYNATK